MWPSLEQVAGTSIPPQARASPGTKVLQKRAQQPGNLGKRYRTLDCLMYSLSHPLDVRVRKPVSRPRCITADRKGHNELPPITLCSEPPAPTSRNTSDACGGVRTPPIPTALQVAGPSDATPLAGLTSVGDAVVDAGTPASAKLAFGAVPPPLYQACRQSGTLT